MRRIETQTVHIDGHIVVQMQTVREVWIRAFLLNGEPNPNFEPSDKYRPRLLLERADYSIDREPATYEEVELILEPYTSEG